MHPIWKPLKIINSILLIRPFIHFLISLFFFNKYYDISENNIYAHFAV